MVPSQSLRWDAPVVTLFYTVGAGEWQSENSDAEVHLIEVVKELAIDLALEFGDPGELEEGGLDPAPAAEFLVVGVEADVVVFAEEAAAVIGLFLAAVDAVFEAAFGEGVAVAGAGFDDLDELGFDADFFFELAVEGGFEGFAGIDAALGELPGAFDADAFGDEDFTGAALEESGDVGAVKDGERGRSWEGFVWHRGVDSAEWGGCYADLRFFFWGINRGRLRRGLGGRRWVAGGGPCRSRRGWLGRGWLWRWLGP